MRWLTKRSRPRRDDGAVATIFGILLAFGVILGFAALSLDVGALMWERRQLQNGADSAALSVATDCATDTTTCGAAPSRARAASLANQNAADSLSDVADVCIAGVTAPDCSAGSGGLPDCLDLPVPAEADGVAQVRTSTRTVDGSALVAPILAQLLPGNDDYDGATVGACARAAWGPVSEIDGMLPVTFSKCEWQDFTNDGTTFAPEPPYTSPPPADVVALERAIVLAEPDKDAHTCGAGPSGYDLAGGFGWLDHSSDTCTASIEIGDWVSADTGKDTPNDCKDEIYASIGTVVWIPVFDCVEKVKLCGDPSKPSGTTAWYHIWGFAAFYLTGVELSGADDAPYNSAIACTGGQRCLYGWFTHDIVPTAEIGPGPDEDTGLTAVQLVG